MTAADASQQKPDSQRIVLDVSTSLIWQRAAVGIVRTERKFAEYLLNAGVNVAFVWLDRKHQHYYRVAEDSVRAMLRYGEHAAATPPESNANAPNGTPRPSALRSTMWKLLHLLPERVEPAALALARQVLQAARASVRLARAVARGVRHRYLRWRCGVPGDGTASLGYPVLHNRARPMHWQSGDVYLAMGLDWDTNDFALLAREKTAHGFRVVLACYDLIPIRVPHLMQSDQRARFSDYFRSVAAGADHVWCISEASRSDLLQFWSSSGISSVPTTVIHLGADVAGITAPSPVSLPDSLLQRPFVLFVSTIEARKNHYLLYRVWERLHERHGDDVPLLVFVGMPGWGVDELLFQIDTNPRTRDHIIRLTSVSDGDLAWLYSHCAFAVYPSLYEGWGLPVTEVLAHGKACVCSTASAVVEAAQGLTPCIDTHDPIAWVVEVERCWRDDAYRARLEARIRAEYRPRLWAEHGVQLLALARSVGQP